VYLLAFFLQFYDYAISTTPSDWADFSTFIVGALSPATLSASCFAGYFVYKNLAHDRETRDHDTKIRGLEIAIQRLKDSDVELHNQLNRPYNSFSEDSPTIISAINRCTHMYPHHISDHILDEKLKAALSQFVILACALNSYLNEVESVYGTDGRGISNTERIYWNSRNKELILSLHKLIGDEVRKKSPSDYQVLLDLYHIKIDDNPNTL